MNNEATAESGLDQEVSRANRRAPLSTARTEAPRDATPSWIVDLIASEISDTLSEDNERPVTGESIRNRATACADYIHARLSAAIPTDNDGKEQEAFEAWASGELFDMTQHPLQWLFLEPKTYSARSGWRAALAYVKHATSVGTPPEGKP